MIKRLSVLVVPCCLAVSEGNAFGEISYKVLENPSACHEVHLGSLSKPTEPENPKEWVWAGLCRPEIRTGHEGEIYLTAVCKLIGDRRLLWVPSREKYAVDLSRADRVRRIDDQAWQAAMPLLWSEDASAPPRGPEARESKSEGVYLRNRAEVGWRWSVAR
jgi:hypothetical protein